MIEVAGISKSFGSVYAVRNVSFHVEQGEILGFLGPNGAGKTTTMRILTGFYPPTSGKASVGGLDVFENSLDVRRKIGYLPENVPLYSEMTVVDYLKFVSEIKGTPRLKRKSEIAEAMDACRLWDMENRKIKHLSKGFRQRTGLAQALLGSPEVLILDEPTIGLDPRQINDIRNLIKSFAGIKTVILSTHILPEVSMTCQRVVIINKGLVAAEDTPENLRAQLAGRDSVRIATDAPAGELEEKLSKIEGVGQVTKVKGETAFIVEASIKLRPELARAVVESGWNLYELTPQSATLEDVFLDLVTSEEETANE